MQNILRTIICILLVSVLSGCFMFNRGNLNNQQTRETIIASLSKKLSQYDVKVFHGADSATLTLSNKDFFVDGSANFTSSAYNALDLILALSRYYQESVIGVTGYSKAGCDYGIGKALATERARRVVEYLWRAGVDSNFMYAAGKKVKFKKSSDNRLLLDEVLIVMNKFVE